MKVSLVRLNLLRIRQLMRNGKHSKAQKLIGKEMSRRPDSVVFSLLHADNTLFSKEIDRAYNAYGDTRRLLAEDADYSDEDRLYIAAYINYRELAIKFHRSGTKFDKAADVAKLIKDLDADSGLKILFEPPE